MEHQSVNSESDIDSLIAQLRKHINNRKAELAECFKVVFEKLEQKRIELMDSLNCILINTESELREKHKTMFIDRHRTRMDTDFLQDFHRDIKRDSYVASLEVNDVGQNEVDIPFISISKETLELDFFLENYFQIKIAPNTHIYKKERKWESSQEDNSTALQGIAVSDFTGEIYVADSGNKCIKVFNNKGECKRKIKDLKMSSPQYICVNEKYLYVSCWDNNTILKLDNKKCVRMHYAVYPDIISGLSVDKYEDLYGCVWKGSSIVVWGKDLVMKSQIKLDNLFITENTQIRDICYYNKEFYVLFKDSIFPVQIFNRKGGLVRCPVKENEISSTKYMTLDQYGNLIVSDSNEKEKSIKIFSNKGELVHSVKVHNGGTSSKGNHGDRSYLRGIGFDCLKGNIYISDSERLYAY